ncbi:hypothetical protein R1flu_006023 [Riccia fluitans]|uniref:Uncharacterized protein n=1 Tax=Riccia fluitans TaxID=41844 RepID=A0ABD1YVT4_9MARC
MLQISLLNKKLQMKWKICPRFGTVFDDDEDVNEVEEEDTLDSFWVDPISRAGTFDTDASQEERTPSFRESLWEAKSHQKPKSDIP